MIMTRGYLQPKGTKPNPPRKGRYRKAWTHDWRSALREGKAGSGHVCQGTMFS